MRSSIAVGHLEVRHVTENRQDGLGFQSAVTLYHQLSNIDLCHNKVRCYLYVFLFFAFLADDRNEKLLDRWIYASPRFH